MGISYASRFEILIWKECLLAYSECVMLVLSLCPTQRVSLRYSGKFILAAVGHHKPSRRVLRGSLEGLACRQRGQRERCAGSQWPPYARRQQDYEDF